MSPRADMKERLFDHIKKKYKVSLRLSEQLQLLRMMWVTMKWQLEARQG